MVLLAAAFALVAVFALLQAAHDQSKQKRRLPPLPVASDDGCSYREPARRIAEPAPYLNPREACPICGGTPSMLYFHTQDCEWQQAYEAAGRRMRAPMGDEEHGTSGWMRMTSAERTMIEAMRPPKRPTGFLGRYFAGLRR